MLQIGEKCLRSDDASFEHLVSQPICQARARYRSVHYNSEDSQGSVNSSLNRQSTGPDQTQNLRADVERDEVGIRMLRGPKRAADGQADGRGCAGHMLYRARLIINRKAIWMMNEASGSIKYYHKDADRYNPRIFD